MALNKIDDYVGARGTRRPTKGGSYRTAYRGYACILWSAAMPPKCVPPRPPNRRNAAICDTRHALPIYWAQITYTIPDMVAADEYPSTLQPVGELALHVVEFVAGQDEYTSKADNVDAIKPPPTGLPTAHAT